MAKMMKIALDDHTFAEMLTADSGQEVLRLTQETDGEPTISMDMTSGAYRALMSLCLPDPLIPLMNALMSSDNVVVALVPTDEPGIDDELRRSMPAGTFVSPGSGKAN